MRDVVKEKPRAANSVKCAAFLIKDAHFIIRVRCSFAVISLKPLTKMERMTLTTPELVFEEEDAFWLEKKNIAAMTTKVRKMKKMRRRFLLFIAYVEADGKGIESPLPCLCSLFLPVIGGL